MKHETEHPQAGQTIEIKSGEMAGTEFWVEDWWDRVAGFSWMAADGNPACMQYGMRSGFASLPTDDEVIYGKVKGLGVLVHQSELEAIAHV